MNLDIAGHWRGGAIKDAGDEAIRLHGKDAINNVNIGPLESLYGAKREDVINYIKTKQQTSLNSDPTIQAMAVKAGLTPFQDSGGFANYGESQAGLLTRIQTAQEGKDKAAKKDEREYLAGVRQEGYEQQNNQLNAQLKASQQQYDHSFKTQEARLAHDSRTQEARLAHTTKQNRLDRRHQSEMQDVNNDLTMQMKIMDNQLAEKRMAYDRETRRMDRRDKMLAQLFNGLGNLGGAFAL